MGNRAEIRRSVFHATDRIDWKEFVEQRLHNDLSAVESIARMECPASSTAVVLGMRMLNVSNCGVGMCDRADIQPQVTLPDKTMIDAQVPESAPKRIVFAGKVLRQHLSMTETQTCRSCIKRSRCRFFKMPPEAGPIRNDIRITSHRLRSPEAGMTVGVKHIGRVLLGMSQYARAHVQHPEQYPWYFTSGNLASASVLLNALEEQLVTEGPGLTWSDVELADEGTAREVLLREAQRREERRHAAREERFLSLPQWMRETLQPIPSRGMTARQRELLAESGIDMGNSSVEAPIELVASDEKDWVEEGAVPGQPTGPMVVDPAPAPMPLQATAGDDTDRPLVDVGDAQELPVVRRFKHLPGKPSEAPVRQFNSMTGLETTGIFRRLGEFEGHRIDLDEVGLEPEEPSRWEEIRPEGGNSRKLEEVGLKLKGGYTISELVGANSFQEAQHLLSLSPAGLEGVHHYNANISPKIVSQEALEEIWSVGEERGVKDELPFLRRVAFDTPVPYSSSGSVTPERLAADKLLAQPEPELLPAALRDSHVQGAGPKESVMDLDEPPEDDSIFDLDARLASDAMRLQRTAAMNTVDASHPPVSAEPEPKADPGENEERRFQAWQHRSKTRGVGVFDPTVDFKYMSDPNRLEQAGDLDAETSGIYFRSSRPLPQDEDFVSTFRRPLDAEADHAPLGPNAATVDVQALKEDTSPKAAPPDPEDLGDIIFPSLPGAGHRPSQKAEGKEKELRRRAGASRSQAPQLGNVRQVRLNDNLADLVKPGAQSSARAALRPRLGEVQPKEGDDPWQDMQKPSLTAKEIQDNRNAAMAAQRVLYRHLKRTNLQKYGAPKERAR
ncbi:unnamed protein product [Symbiodinium sp. KB8]|nr:unnamed protein product [Symbiodinium sp. KB8]